MTPVLVDAFCGAGGCTKGYQDAGFYVVGVDIEPQPNYCGDEFFQADALEFLRELPVGVDAVHASPPCQFRTAYKRRPGHVKDAENLIPATRQLLQATGVPYVIENVPGARDELREPEQLCGSSFGLDVRRHRLFETSFPLAVPLCDHAWQTPRFPAATNRAPNSRRTVEVGVWRIPLQVQQAAMGIDWMTLAELSQSIPPAYTEHIGEQLLAHIMSEELAA